MLQDFTFETSKVLIVDDSRVDRAILRGFCGKVGLNHISEAADGLQALALIERMRPDLVFLDMHMPLMDGLELCAQLKARGLIEQMVIIMQTATHKREVEVKAFEVGITDFVTKPITYHEMMARVVVHLERRHLRLALACDYERLQAEMKEAAALQHILLPATGLLDDIRARHGIDIAHHYQPSSTLAGDYLAVRLQGEKSIAFIAADVSGHGLAAALYAFSLHALLLDHALDTMRPDELLLALNTRLAALMPVGRFITCFIGVLDVPSRMLHYSAAGSPLPIWMRDGVRLPMDTSGQPLGAFADARYRTHTVPLRQGDTLLLYSDALVETPGADGVCLNAEQTAGRIAAMKDAPADMVLAGVLDLFHAGNARTLNDDLSLLVCRV